jgi:DNA-binding LytR/AlgR family response regulator
MKKISCIAIDDEPLALGLIVSHIKKTPFLELQGKFDNPIDAMDFLQENSVQLIFLDIQMPDLTGVEFAATLDNNCKVIFTTAYDKYAVEGFRLHALDYLLKPISYKVFLESAMRAKKHFELVNSVGDTVEPIIKTDENYFFVKADYQLHRIEYTDILYFEGLKDYIKLYLESGKKPIVFNATMKSVEAKLSSERFMRVHRSYIVNLEKVKIIERYRILFGKERVPVSNQYKSAFDEFITRKFL